MEGFLTSLVTGIRGKTLTRLMLNSLSVVRVGCGARGFDSGIRSRGAGLIGSSMIILADCNRDVWVDIVDVGYESDSCGCLTGHQVPL